jgi:hypothetical protein
MDIPHAREARQISDKAKHDYIIKCILQTMNNGGKKVSFRPGEIPEELLYTFKARGYVIKTEGMKSKYAGHGERTVVSWHEDDMS